MSTRVVLVLGALLLASAAFADDDEVRVLLPGGEAAQIVRDQKSVVPAKEHRPFDIGLTIGSWSPGHLATDSHVADATNFRLGAMPLVSASLIQAPFATGSAGTLALRAGLGVESLVRSGTLSFPAGPETGEQHALLLPLEAGIEARPAFAQWRDLGFYLDATVNPMFMVTERSPFDDGRSILGIGGGAVLGSTYNLRRLVPSDALYLDMNLVARVGELSGGSANGLGLQAGVRLQM